MIPQIQYIKLDECAKFSQGKQVPVEEQYAEPFEDSVRFVRIVDFTNENEPPRYIKNYGDSYQVNSNDLIMIRYGSQTAGKVVRGFSGIIANNMFKVDIDRTLFDINFAYYYLSSPKIYKMLMNAQSSSTMPAITFGMLGQIEVPLFNLETQRKIAKVLGAIDEKIELNKSINKNLEQQAQAIFNNTFVNLEDVPNGWQVSCLSDIAEYLNGLAMQKFRPKENEKGIPVLKIKELGQGYCNEQSDLCSPNIKSDYIINNGDVIFSWSGTLLLDIWCGGLCGLNQHLFKVTSQKFDKWFYYFWTKYHLNKFIFIAKDKATTMGHIKREDLDKSEVLIPDTQTYSMLNSILSPIFELIIKNRIENSRLTQLRDTLLPKLMNSEIDVDKVEV